MKKVDSKYVLRVIFNTDFNYRSGIYAWWSRYSGRIVVRLYFLKRYFEIIFGG